MLLVSTIAVTTLVQYLYDFCQADVEGEGRGEDLTVESSQAQFR